MPSAARVWPILAALAAGAALSLTRSVLDQVVIDGQAVRVAFLPPWETLGAFVALALIALQLVYALNRAAHRVPPRASVGRLVLPALALGVLVVPYLPMLPDRLPVLQVLAGPLRGVVWLVVAGLAAWVWWQHRLLTAAWLSRRTLAQATLLVALATALVSGAAAARLTHSALFPAGDEPHYLIIAQSLWRDGDLRIENNHERGDYREYFGQDLDPHYLTRGKDGEIYSIHPVGLPVILAPVYALGGYLGVLVLLIGMSAAAAALAWRWVAVTLGAPAATYAWATIAISAPFLLNTFTVYPEIAAALAVMIALTSRHPLVIGIACGVLPWLSTKYAPMSLILLLVTGPVPVAPGSAAVSAFLKRAAPYGVLLALWFAFFYWVWGSPWPQAPYGALVQTSPRNLIFGAPGLLFDQEYGLLPYAPAYILAVTGLWALWRAGGDQRLAAVRVVLVFGALLATVGAFRIWWGGAAAPARPLASGLLVLAMPMAAAFAAAPPGSARRAAQHLLLWVGVGILGTLTFAQEGLLIANGRDGTSSLLGWWAPRWELWTLAPSFIHHEAPTALAHALVWLLIAAAAAVLLRRWRTGQPAHAALGAFGVFGGALLAVSLILPLLPDDPAMPRVDLAARSRLAALDRYDSRALPAAVVFDPLRRTAAAELLPLMTLGVSPGLRPDPQPVRVIHNGRFSLPAGRYRLDVTFDAGASGTGPGSLALQIGRIGAPLDTWTVDPAAGPWSTIVDLPVDAAFVGLRGSREMEAAIRAILFTPLHIVDEGRRPRIGPVLGAARYAGGLVFLHDDQVNPEPEGFWIAGRRATRVSVAPIDPAAAPTLLLRSDTDQNRVTLRTHGWVRTLDLRRGVTEEVTLPAGDNGVVDVTILASDGFVPIERDPTSRDRRFLGVWVELP